MNQPVTSSDPSSPDPRADADAAAMLERQNRELMVLNAIAAGLNESIDLGSLLAATLARVAELLGLRTAWVWLLDDAGGQPYLATAQNLPAGLKQSPRAMEGRCLCLNMLQGGTLRGAVNVLTCSRLRHLRDGTDGLRYHASIPLQARGRSLGVMNVSSIERQTLSAEELRLLHTIGEMLGTAIERARLFDRSAELGATEERLRLAREMHDTIAQGLTATALQLETAEALLEAGAGPSRVAEAIERALRTTRQNLDEVRRSVLDLRAAPLEGRSLADAIEQLCRAAGASRVAVHYECVGAGHPLPTRVETALYRIAQEALFNVERHAPSATRVTVRLTCEPGAVTLVIEDDGAGFEPTQVPTGRFGLVGMRERARLIGGDVQVETAPGSGTRIRAVIPLGSRR